MTETKHESMHGRIPEFAREARQVADEFGLKLKRFDDDGIVALLGSGLLLQFSYDRSELIVSLGSQEVPHVYFPLEYVAVQQGWIPHDDLLEHGRQLDRFVVAEKEDAHFPGPLRTLNWLLEMVRYNQGALEVAFSKSRFAVTRGQLVRIAKDYMNASEVGRLAEQDPYQSVV